MEFKHNYIVDDNNQKVAVQMDISTYEKIIDTLESYSLMQFIKQNEDEELLSLDKAKEYYQALRSNDSQIQ